MRYFQANPACGCSRCRTRGLMGPAVLVTLGLLFLLANMADYPFERTWPILLIVIGAIQVVRYVIPDDGHLNPGQYPPPYAGPYAAPPYQYTSAPDAAPARPSVVTPPPAPSAGALGEGNSENGEGHNG